MMGLFERHSEIAPGQPAPDMDVASPRGEVDSLRKAVKQVRDAAWNLEKARDSSDDEDRKGAYRDFKDVMDDAHSKLAIVFKDISDLSPAPAPKKPPERDEVPPDEAPDELPAEARRYGMAEAGQEKSKYPKPMGFKDKPDPTDTSADQVPGDPQAFKPSSLILKDRPDAEPEAEADDDDTDVARRGTDATGTDRTLLGSPIYAAREAKMDLVKSLREAQGALEKFQKDTWYPGPTTWNPTRDQAAQGSYRLGDKFVGQVDSIAAGYSDLPPHPAHVAKAISDAAHEMYAEGRQTEWSFPWFVYGMPGLLPEGVIITQEEVYRAIRKLAGEHSVTVEYRDEVITELEKLGHKVTTHRPQTHERMIWNH